MWEVGHGGRAQRKAVGDIRLGWMLHVRRWRGPSGLELAILFQAPYHLSSCAPNVLFMLSIPPPLPPPSPHIPNVQLITSLPFILLPSSPLCVFIQDRNYTTETVFLLFISHSLSSSLPVAHRRSAWRGTPRPKSPFAEVVLKQTSRQSSRGVEFHPEPFMIDWCAK